MGTDKLGFIGAGNLAESMIRGIIRSGYLDPGQIVISDADPTRLRHVHETLGPSIARSNADCAGQTRIVVLAVKPTQVASVAAEIESELRADQFVVSVAAATSVETIQAALGDGPTLCRIMPNLSMSVRQSAIGLYADAAIDEGALRPVYELLSQVGQVYRIAEESQMAAITALSGSAPAYYVMMADALVRYGVAQGIPRELATTMILGTMEGSAAWARQSKIPLDQLWRRVVTPGGTTEAGITYYDDKGFVDIFVEGLSRSTERARELGDR